MLVCLYYNCLCFFFFFFKQKTAYELRISDWSSDVCSSDLIATALEAGQFSVDEKQRHALAAGFRILGGDDDDTSVLAVGDEGLRAVEAIAITVRLSVGLDRLQIGAGARRSEECRVGKECVRTCRSRRLRYH